MSAELRLFIYKITPAKKVHEEVQKSRGTKSTGMTRRSQWIKIDIGNQSKHSISININPRLLSIDIGNQSQSNLQKKIIDFY